MAGRLGRTSFFSKWISGSMVLSDQEKSTGTRIWVHATDGSDAGGSGFNPDKPVATIDYAVGLCTADKGDTIIVMPGHTETLTAAITADIAGIKIVGIGQGALRPQLTINANIDGLDITAANVEIENLYFNEGTAAHTAAINVAAANASIKGCRFDCGANDLESITVTAAGDGFNAEDCEYIITANGPDAAIELEAAGIDDVEICNCEFLGGSSTNVWDAAAINAGSNAVTNLRVHGNYFLFGTAIAAAASVSTAVWDNVLAGARASADSPLKIYAADGRTATGAGTPQDPTTIVEAVARATAAGDIVKLLPGTYTITAALAADVNGVTIVPAHGKGTVEIANDTDDVISIQVTGVGVVVQGLMFTKGINNTNDGKCFIDVDANRCTIEDCTFDLEARLNADAINIATGTKDHVIRRNMFTSASSGKSYIAGAASSSIIEKNFFDASAADALCYEQLASPGDGICFRDNEILSDGAVGALMSWQAAPGKNVVVRNYILGSGADTDSLGDDSDNDPYIMGNVRDGAADGTTTAINPSVS